MQRAESSRRLRAIAVAVLVGLLLVSAKARFASPREGGARSVLIRLPRGSSPELAAIRFEPSGHVLSMRLDGARVLSLETDGTALTARVPELCPVSIPAHDAATPLLVIARPWLDLGDDLAQIGYDATFEVVARRGCPEASAGRVEFRQVEGSPLAEWSVDGADRLRARTLPLSHFFSGPLPLGVVAVSPRSQGRYVVEATLLGAGLPPVRRRVSVTSIARATGMSSLAVSQRVMLGGDGWHVARAPFGGRAQVQALGGVATFQPDVAGRWTLADAEGKPMAVQAMAHDETPLDCGRSECHASISEAALASPMSEALERPMRSEHAATGGAGCLLDCHVVGERGLHDGGFLDSAEELGWEPAASADFAALPHSLQRLGGVRCTSCHGPGAIPEQADRARILRASVCATCHDAPPANTHVEAWSRSAMARSDRTLETRADPACARCHTTGGFLHAIGVRDRADASRDPDGAVVGIACAACHAVHGDHVGDTLVRAIEAPPSLGGAAPTGPSSICSSCHAPARDELVPSASSTALVAGRVRLPDALGGGEERGPAPHATLPNGCLSCHGASAQPESSDIDHSFRVQYATCASCHASGVPEETRDDMGRSVQERARALLLQLGAGCSEPDTHGPPHARRHRDDACALGPDPARARFLASLVAEDGAAALHNAPFTRRLLDQAEAIVQHRPGPRHE